MKGEWKICPACGVPTEGVETNTGVESGAAGKKKFRKVIVAVAAVAAVLFLLVMIFGGGDAVSDLKDSTLPTYSEEITIGEAFEDFFSEPSRSTYESDGTDVVVFSGFAYSEAGDKIKVTMEIVMYEESITWQDITLYNVDSGGQHI